MQRLPIELVTYITNSLELPDIFNLGLTCRQFNYLITNEDICRAAVETHAPFSPEARIARSNKRYARSFRQLAKTRDAITTAKPFAVVLLAFCDDFVYCNGMLCYTVGRESLRLLDLHGSAQNELVIDTRALLQSVPKENLGNRKYNFRPVHYAEGILSCLYTPAKIEGPSRLIVVDLHHNKIIACRLVRSAQSLFVRNDRKHLYYGTHSVTGDDGFKRWALRRFDIEDEEWAPGQLNLEHLVGSDIGSTVCFEIFDDYLYGLSSLTSFEAYEADLVSYYHGFRLPMGGSREDMQLVSKKGMWRRKHREGPIDDRWSTLDLERDIATGRLTVVECRREWLVNNCSSTRTTYRTELRFPNEDEVPDDTQDRADEKEEIERDPSMVHVGDSGSTTPTITLTHCFIRSYNQFCKTFVDLLNDPTATDSVQQRLQLRSMSRLHPLASLQKYSSSGDLQTQAPTQSDTDSKISWWLPDMDTSRQSTSLTALDTILNPKGPDHNGAISGVMDDRSIVYAVGDRTGKGQRSLVFISFDPAIRLQGLNHWPGGPAKPLTPLQNPFADELRAVDFYPTPQSLPPSASSSRNASFCDGGTPVPSPPATDADQGPIKLDLQAWGRKTSPMYFGILRATGKPVGFNFAYCGDHLGPRWC